MLFLSLRTALSSGEQTAMLTIQTNGRRENESARTWVYRVILESIVYLDLHPNTLLDIGELQSLFGISRTPIREALIQLAQEGFVSLYPQKGSYVAPINLDDVEEARFIRLCLEKEVLRIACETCELSTHREMRYLLDCQRDALATCDARVVHELDEKFHLAYYTGCGKEKIWHYLRKNNLHFYRVRTVTITQKKMQASSYNDHENIYSALVERDVDKAIEAMDAHLHVRNNWHLDAVIRQSPDWFCSSNGFAAV